MRTARLPVAGSRAVDLENQLPGEKDFARSVQVGSLASTERAGNYAEGVTGRIAISGTRRAEGPVGVATRVQEVRRVGNSKRFRLELEVESFVDLERAEEAQVKIGKAGSANGISVYVAFARSRRRCVRRRVEVGA